VEQTGTSGRLDPNPPTLWLFRMADDEAAYAQHDQRDQHRRARQVFPSRHLATGRLVRQRQGWWFWTGFIVATVID